MNGQQHRLKIYPPIWHTVDERYDCLHLDLSTWETELFAFLDENIHR